MRIRKRAVPLPLSLLSPVPFSDPHIHLVQLHHNSNPQPSDHLSPPPSGGPRGFIRCDRNGAVLPQPHMSMEIKLAYEDEKNNEQGEENINGSSKQSGSDAVADTVVLPPSTPSNQNEVLVAKDGRWCDGEKAIPLKKRKVCFEMNGAVVTREAMMKSKTYKKCTLHNISEEEEKEDDDDEEEERRARAKEDDSTSALNTNGNNNKKNKTKSKKVNDTIIGGARNSSTIKSKGKKGGSIMEGSRCSRVNGRGWRCFQPTLVGYSLCEHHLGKGRLRSMSSVRVRASSSSSKKPSPTSQQTCKIALGGDNTTGNINIQEESSCEHDHSKPLSTFAGAGNKKRTRRGVVKARSLSSLLCQPDTAVVQLEATSGVKQREM